MIRPCVVLVLASTASAQFVYDFNHLNGSDPHPFTLLHGQDNWTEETFNAANRCGVTATLSHDGTPSLRFQESGPGYGCDASRINDGSWLFAGFAGVERSAMFQCDMQVGYWGGTFGLAHDTSGDGIVRRYQNGERGVRFSIGTQSNQQLRLYRADQSFVSASLASAGGIGGGEWVRVRVVMDLAANAGAGSGSLFVQNLSQNATSFTAVPGLQDIDLALDQAASDATNPLLWDALWLHFEGATYGLDNIEVGWAGTAVPFGVGCAGASGPVELAAVGPFTVGTTIDFVSGNHAANAPGLAIYGLDDSSWQGVPLPLSVDPVLGTSGCTLYTDPVVSLLYTTTATAPATMTSPFPVPPSALTGFECFVQHACLEPVPGGWSFSNALRVRFP
ncbi:MAG: hypothetical protein KAI24_13180 [Planctomycetes bacterium]|nr:hypothetical protein [Planctomycetota bacterium]